MIGAIIMSVFRKDFLAYLDEKEGKDMKGLKSKERQKMCLTLEGLRITGKFISLHTLCWLNVLTSRQ